MRRSPLLAWVAPLALLAACAQPNAAPQKLAAVAPLPAPSLPSWIASVGPHSPAQSLAQIRVLFNKPVTEVSSLEGDGPQGVLSHLRVDPALKGRFVVLTPRMIGFVADQALPSATRVRVTMSAGLRDLAGDSLNGDVAWTFETAPLTFSGLPTSKVHAGSPTPPPVDLQPKLRVDANTPVDVASLAAHAHLRADGTDVSLDARAVPTPSPAPGADTSSTDFDASTQVWSYELQPRTPLHKDTAYALAIDAGVEPQNGNAASRVAFAGDVRTYGAFRILPTPVPPSSGSNRFEGGDPVVAFTNPVDPKTVAGNVTISPEPSPAPRIVAFAPDDSETEIAVDPYALEPDRDYTIALGTGLKDVFGQPLAAAQTVAVHTGDFAPGMWAPTGSTVVPAGAGVDLNFYATNLPDNRYRAAYAALAPVQVIGGAAAYNVLPSPAASWPLHKLDGARVNVQSVVRIPVQSQLRNPFGALAYGFYAPIGYQNESSATGIVQVTNLGVFAQWFPGSGMVLVQHLDDGATVPRARVDVYRLDSSGRASPQRCATGTTDDAGEYRLGGTDLDRCYASADPSEAPSLGVVVRNGQDVATVQTFQWSGIYNYDVAGDWSGGAPLSRGTLFSDRQLYQPGERAELTGIAYYVRGNAVVADANATYTVSLADPNNASKRIATVATDRYGIFTLPLTFAKTQALGYYTVTATGSNGNVVTGSLRVAAFKPPNFKMQVSLHATSATPGSSVVASAEAAYLFGAPLQGGKAHAYVTRSFAQLAPPGWDEFSFGRQWFWPEQQPSVTTDVLQQDLPLDSSGSASLSIAIPRDLPAPMTYQVDIEATDVSNLSVSDTQSFLALPADGTIGLASDTVGAAKSGMPIRVIVTDDRGKPIPGRNVHLDLQRMTYVSATQAQEGGEAATQSVKYDSVATADVTSASQAVTALVTPPDAGSYRVRATFAGSADPAAATDIQVFAYGQNAADFGENTPSAVKITLDKKKYKVGDMATALVGSSFDHADVYAYVIRNDVLYRTTLRDVAGAPHISFRVTPQMLPNAALEAVVVRRGRKLAQMPAGTLDSLARVGVGAFHVDVSDRYLKLGFNVGHATLQPGGAQRVSFTLRDVQGRPVRGKIVAMAVNDAILQLSGYRLPDLVQTVFADQPISTRFADNRENLTLQTPKASAEKGFGYGGGFLEGAAGTRVRTLFLPMAYFGTVETGGDGSGAVNFKVPDDLTTWRVMAVAVGQDDAHFATGDTTFITTLPLMANPLLPQFARPGDTMNVGASVMNQTGSPASLDLYASLTGALRFGSGSNLTENETQPTGMAAYRFPVTVGTPAPSTVAVSAAIGSVRDAFSVPFDVVERGSTESVIESGATSTSSAIPVKFDRPGKLSVTLANSVVPQFATPAARAMASEGLGLCDSYASRLIVASSLAVLAPKYRLHLDFDAREAQASSLRALVALQRGDGGFLPFATSRVSDPFCSAYALEALAFAGSHGVAIPSAAVAQARSFASDVLANPGRFTWCLGDVCKARLRFSMLGALAAAGDRRTDFLSQIYAQRATFDSATQVRLARYLLANNGWQQQGAALADNLQQAVNVSGRYAVANLGSQWDWLGGEVDAQSEMLQLLVERHAPIEQIDGAVRALVSQQCACGWPTLNATASAVRALDAYAATERLTASTASVKVGNTNLGTATFGTTGQSHTIVAETSLLHGGNVVVRSSGGLVHYLVLYTYSPASDAPGALSAFRVTRTVSDIGAGVSRATMDLAPVTTPIALETGHVFDVGLQIAIDHPVDRLAIEDPLPAGFEAVDTTFKTSNSAQIPQSDNWQIDDRQIYADRVTAFAQHLEPGIYQMHYLVRSVTPGRYNWPGARAYLQDAPEQFGRTAAAILELK